MKQLKAFLIAAFAVVVLAACPGNRTVGVDEGGDAPVCEAGQPVMDRACSANCAPGFAGRRVCNSTGTAFTRECRCVSTGSSPTTTCVAGENRGLCTLACTTSSGYAGVTQGSMLCNVARTAFECVRTSGACMGSVCQPGAPSSCSCGGGVNGTQNCNSDGTGYTACACPTPQPFCITGQNNGPCNIPCSGGGSQPGTLTCNSTRDGWTCVPNPGSACPSTQFCYDGQSNGPCMFSCSGGTQPGTLICSSARSGWICVPNPGSTCSGGTSCSPGMLYTTSICASRCSSGSGRQVCLSTGVLEDVCQCTIGTGGSGGTTSISCTTNGAWVTTGCGLTCPSGTIGQQLCSGGYLQAACQCNAAASSGECANGATQVWGGCPSAPCGDRAPIRVCVNGRWTNPSTGGPICDCAGGSAPRGHVCDPARPPTRNGCLLPAGTPACLSGQTTGQQCISGGLEYTGCICVNQS